MAERIGLALLIVGRQAIGRVLWPLITSHKAALRFSSSCTISESWRLDGNWKLIGPILAMCSALWCSLGGWLAGWLAVWKP